MVMDRSKVDNDNALVTTRIRCNANFLEGPAPRDGALVEILRRETGQSPPADSQVLRKARTWEGAVKHSRRRGKAVPKVRRRPSASRWKPAKSR
jgi:hypothetical protein